MGTSLLKANISRYALIFGKCSYASWSKIYNSLQWLNTFLQIIQGTNLKILGLVELDSGIYQCVATNPVGNVQAAAQLKVMKKGMSFYTQ